MLPTLRPTLGKLMSYVARQMGSLSGYDEQKQSLVNIVDKLAESDPDTIYALFPRSAEDYGLGFQSVSYKQFANLVNGLSWWITAQLGKGCTQETITYTGPNDLRQNAMILACVKSGYKLLLSSPRNQRDALRALLDEATCKALLCADLTSQGVSAVQEARSLPAYQIPSLNVLLSNEFPHYPASTSEESKTDPLVILHTSGTTSSPKPITWTNSYAAAYLRQLETHPPVGEADWSLKDFHMRGVRMLVMMPPFHAAYIWLTLFVPLANRTTVVLPPANASPTAESIIEAVENTHVNTVCVPPHLVSQIATNEQYLNTMAEKVQCLIYGGGKVVEAHGDLVSSRMRFFSLYGATEVGTVPDLMPSDSCRNQLWNYMQPHPRAGWEFRLHDGEVVENVYEAWIVKKRDSQVEPPVFSIFNDRTEYFTRDLFVPHTTIPNMWKWHGRIDDTICLRTAANVSPVRMENGISEVSSVRGVLMLGNGQPRPVLLVEREAPVGTLDSEHEFLESIWNAVNELNYHYFEEHRILKCHVIVADARKPMARSLKGSVQRRATEKLYETEIKALFSY
ncbi:hypothetical protein F4779DRAFT_109702 [Xylariaceae sp. FL0662B]|nr:hypothetical protein F4779DRAFT_109702 [Xylariaceae sp. FL0662B]